MDWQALLDVQTYCKQKSNSCASADMKLKYDEIQQYLLQKSLIIKSIPSDVGISVKNELRLLEKQTKNQKPEDPGEVLQSFDDKYPGVLHKEMNPIDWNDVILEESLKSELKDISSIALNYFNVMPVGSKLGRVKSILMYGVCGTGKSSSAHAMANQPSSPKVFEISAAQVCQSYFGDSEKFLQELFHTFRKTIPSIMYIEEIDFIGK